MEPAESAMGQFLGAASHCDAVAYDDIGRFSEVIPRIRLYCVGGVTEVRIQMGSKKLIALIVVSALLAFTLPACVFSSSNEASKSTELKTLVIGTDPYPPFVSDDADGNASGIDVDILTEALGRIGYKPEFKYIAWQKKNELLATGELDCVAGCFSMTGREADYRWAGPYMKSRQVVAVEPSSLITSFADLEGKSIAVQSTTKPEGILLNHTNPDMPEVVNVFSFSDRSCLIPALLKGSVDAIAAHETSILQYEQDYGVDVRILDESLLDVGLGCAFNLNDHRDIDAELSGAFEDMIEDGTMYEILSRYFEDPSPFLQVGDVRG